MKVYCISVFCLLIVVAAATSFGQNRTDDKPVPCIRQTANIGKYKMLSIGRGVELQIDLEIKPKYRTDENFIAIAKEFREKYCRDDRMRITYFGSKKQWTIVDPKNLDATPLAIFYFNKSKGEEGLEFYNATKGKVESRRLKFR